MSQDSAEPTVAQMVQKLIASGKISRQDYYQLSKLILADEKIDEEERQAVNRIFDAIQVGRLKIVD